MGERLLTLVFIFSALLGRAAPSADTPSARQEQCPQEHRQWVAQALQKMQSIQTGMTRKELLEVFTTEGGLSTGLHRTYVSQECPYFKVDVEFEAVGRPSRDGEGRVTLVEDNRDVIVKISKPYLRFSTMD
jgi:hypothetical protein